MAVIQILVVEDDSLNAAFISGFLKEMGYGVQGCVSSGAEALNVIAETPPDIILMDIHLKGDMDGIETARRIHQLYQVPVIYITAAEDHETIERSKHTDPYGYVIKPFESIHLKVSIEMALNRRRIEMESQRDRQLFLSAFQTIGYGVVMIDQGFCISYANPAAVHLLNLSTTEMISHNVQRLMDDLVDFQAETFQAQIKNVIATGVPHKPGDSVPLSIKRGASQLLLEYGIYPILVNKDTASGAVIMLLDVTDKLKMAEDRLRHGEAKVSKKELEGPAVAQSVLPPDPVQSNTIQVLAFSDNEVDLTLIRRAVSEPAFHLSVITSIVDFEALHPVYPENLSILLWGESSLALGPNGSSGLQFYQKLKVNSPKVKVMFLCSSNYDISNLKDLGSDISVLQKPFYPEDLLSAINTLLKS